MNEMPKHYSLIHEKPDHFMVHDKRDGKAFPISKKGLHPATQLKVLRLPKFSNGGEIKKMDDGGEAGDDYLTQFNAQAAKDYDKGMDDSSSAGPSINDQLKSGAYSDQPSPISAPATTLPGMDPIAPADAAIPQPLQGPAPMPNQPSGPQAQANQPPVNQVAPQQAPDFNQVPQGGPNLNTLNNALGEERSGINQQAQGQVDQNRALAEIQRQHLVMEKEYNDKYQQTMQVYQKQNQELADSVANQRIDPDKYWENHSRIGAAIATVISGIGAGLQHSTQNLAMDVIQKGIDRSIDSQKAEIGKKENLLSNNLRVQGNLMAAETATRIQMNAMLQGKIALAAAQTGDPMILGAAKQKNAQIAQAAIPQQMQLAQYQTQMHMREQLSKMDTSNMDPAQIVNYLPNIPQEAKAQILKEIDTATNVHNNATRMAEAQRNAANFHSANLVPGKNNVYQDQLHTLLGPTFNDLHESLREASMNNVFNGVTPKFGDSVLSDPQEKVNTLMNYMRSKQAASTAKSYGLDLSKFNSTRFPEESFHNKGSSEGKTATGPNGQKIIMQGGQWRPLK